MDTKRRSYDIFDIEERVHALELGGGDTPTPSGGSWDYSTTETDTHQKWIDGKEIYCKVITGTFIFPQNNGTVNIADISTFNISTIIGIKAVAIVEGTFVLSCANPMCFVDSNNMLKGINFGAFNANAIILFYTKTESTKSTKRSKK